MASTIIASYSETDTARQCGLKHRIAYRERWVGITKSPALTKGTLWHEVMESFYLVIMFFQQVADGKWADSEIGTPPPLSQVGVLEHAYKAGMAHLIDDRGEYISEVAELIGWMFHGYIEMYGIDSNWKILQVEGAHQFWLPNLDGKRSRFKLKMKLDLVVRDLTMNKVLVVDHKSGKDLPYDKALDLDDQFALYVAGMKALGLPVFGAVHNATRTQRNKDQSRNPQTLESRHKRTPLYRTDIELAEVVRDCYKTLKQAYSVKIGEEGRSPNTDTCRWRCDYTEACLASRKGMDLHEFLLSSGFEQNWTRH